jgi:hypothetical protein
LLPTPGNLFKKTFQNRPHVMKFNYPHMLYLGGPLWSTYVSVSECKICLVYLWRRQVGQFCSFGSFLSSKTTIQQNNQIDFLNTFLSNRFFKYFKIIIKSVLIF